MTTLTTKEEYLKFIDEADKDIRVNKKKEIFFESEMIAKLQPVKQIK